MSRIMHRDLEGGSNPRPVDDNRGHGDRPLLGETDSSRPLYSRYSKIAEEEDNKIVEYCHKDTEGTMILSGLFAATVGALLTVSIPDLKPNPQDTSAFYLENIYLFGIPNVSNTSNPSALAKAPAFSPPSYAIWVNSLWFLSLAVSLSGATVATLYRNWVSQYIAVTQQPGYTLEKRARIRAIFAKGNPRLSVIWGTGGGPIFLHLSLLLFFIGAVIYLFNINRSVFYAVIWWVAGAIILYILRTVAAFFESHDLVNTPLSPLALRIYLGISYALFQVCSRIPRFHGLGDNTRTRYRDLSDRYSEGFMIGKQRAAWEIASKPSKEIDAQILERILLTLDEDYTLEAFFDAIPGFCNSKLCVLPLPFPVQRKLRRTLDGFLDRTFSSNSVSESVLASRFITCLNAAHVALGPNEVSGILDNVLNGRWNKALESVEIMNALRFWGHIREHDMNLRRIIACFIPRVRRRDDRWTRLVKEAFDVSDSALRDYLAHGDSVLLFILIHISRQANRAGSWSSGILLSLSNFDVRNTLPGLQHDFCTLWNEIVQEARNHGSFGTPVQILREIRHLYIALHQDTHAAPTVFSASTTISNFILEQPLSYPLCDITTHRSHVTVGVSVSNSRTVSRQVKETSIIAGPSTSNLTSPQAPAATSPALPVHISPRPIDTSPSSASNDVGAASLLPASSVVGLSTPASPPLSHITPLPNPALLAPLPSTTPSHPTSNATLTHLRARGPMDTGTMYFVNAVLQLLVHSPPFWNVFRELGDLKGLRGAGVPETGGGATSLVDATMKFFEEFMPPMQQLPQQAARGKLEEDEEDKNVNKPVYSFEPTYIYDAMREKEQLKKLLDDRQQDAEEFLGTYLDALDEELIELQTFISAHKLASAADKEELEEGTQSGEGQNEVAEKDFMASSAESPISRIFGGKSRSTVRAPGQPDVVTIETWRSLRLNIQPDSVNTVQDALAYVSQPQPVQVSQSGSSEGSQQVLLEALPPVLVLNLKRDAAADGTNKIGKPVRFSAELEIPPEIMAPVSGKSVEPLYYKLYGVLYRRGEPEASGHYTVDVLHPNGGSGGGEAWLHIDDEAVSVVRHEEVFGGHDKERGDDRCAYMLFYCRTDPTQT